VAPIERTVPKEELLGTLEIEGENGLAGFLQGNRGFQTRA
jgi:hypothetical protein